MILVVLRETNEIKFKVDAWEQDCEEKARAYIREKGYVCTGREITLSGNMILWIE